MESRNPATGELLRRFDELTADQLEERLERARQAFLRHRATPLSHRSERLRRLADLVDAEKVRLGTLMTLEMGKTLKSAVGEAEKCAWVCRHYADHGPQYLADEPVATSATRSYVRHLPIGPVLAVMPWNFPFWQVFRFAAPALMAGNVGLLKHASNVPQCALAIEELFTRAGFSDGVFQTLLVGAARVERLIADPRIEAVTLTGSEAAGAQVGAAAGRAIKKSVLELGGSDPFIVLPSADVELAAKTAVLARLINNGQSCIAAKRFIVHDAVYARFERSFVELMRAAVVGDPLREQTQVGPLATAKVRDELFEQVERAVAAGARVLCGARRVDGPGYFFSPTVLADAPPGSPAYREELFGPVASLFRVGSLDEALRLANDTRFGLGASAWTTDPAEQERLVNELEAGQTFLNAMVASDPRLPFGGVKRSGYGRELAAVGLREFVNAKTVWVA